MTGERRPSMSAQLPFPTRLTLAREEEVIAAAEAEAEVLRPSVRLGQARRRKSCVQLGVFQGCPHEAQGSGEVKECSRKYSPHTRIMM